VAGEENDDEMMMMMMMMMMVMTMLCQVSSTTGEAELLIAHAPNTNSLDSARIGRGMQRDPNNWKWQEGKALKPVQTVALDDFLEGWGLPFVDLIKVGDWLWQGGELGVQLTTRWQVVITMMMMMMMMMMT
jgi:hypothetical protein